MTSWLDRSTHEHTGVSDSEHHGQGGRGWMMMICCIPMIIIAVVLVATGVVGAGFISVALMCTAMMWFMMRAMGGMGHDG
jgi:hypothetical protein